MAPTKLALSVFRISYIHYKYESNYNQMRLWFQSVIMIIRMIESVKNPQTPLKETPFIEQRYHRANSDNVICVIKIYT